MKALASYICFLLIGLSVNSKAELPNTSKNNGGELVITSSNPVNNYLDVIINKEEVDKDTSVKSGIGVQIVNHEGTLVFSSTKSVNQFSIYTGGLPEGEYELSCKLGSTVLKRKFAVKHSKG